MMNATSQGGAFRNVRPVIGRDFSEAMRTLWPEPVAAEIIGHFRHTLETGEPYYSPRFINPRHDVPTVESYEWELHRMILPDGQYGVICYYFDSTKLREAEEALRLSEEKYRTLFESMTQGVVYQNAEGKVISANPAAEAILGLTFEQMKDRTSGDPQWKSIHENGSDFSGGTHPTMTSLMTGNKTRNAVMGVYNSKLGEYRWLKIDAVPQFRPGEDKPYQVYSLFDDITERKAAEEALRKAEERLQLTLQASGVGTFEIDLSTGVGRWNTVEYELLGLKPGDAPADPETFFRYVHPQDLVHLRAEWEEATRIGRLNTEFRVIRADGQECWLAGKGQFVFTETAGEGSAGVKRPLRFLGVNFDITERKAAEQKMVTAHKQVQSIIDNTTSLVYAFDPGGRFLLANAAVAELLNSTPEQMIGKRRHEFMPKEDANWHEANDRQVIEMGRALEFEEHSQLKGRSITWLTTKFPLRDGQGRMYAVGGISADVSERKRAEEELQQRTLELQHLTETLEQRVNERTAELADLSSQLVTAQENERRRVSYDLHDNVWQMLVAIRFSIDNLFSGQEDWGALRNKSKQVMKDIVDLVGKIRSLQGDLWPYVLDDIGILATIDWYCRDFEKNHSGLGIEKTNDITETEIPSSAKIVIYRILQETLSNIAKHSQANHVTLRLTKNDHGMELTVEDNGIGFDPEEKIAKRSPWGGLGLLSIKARTELSGGTFGVESAKGKGTTVRASWPLHGNG